MTTRKRRRRSIAKAQWHVWEEWHDKLFRLTGDQWTRPDRVQFRPTMKGGTYSAIYHDQDGVACRPTVRLAFNAQTKAITVLDETMSMRLKAKAA